MGAGSEILTQLEDHNLKVVEIPINVRYELLPWMYNQNGYFSLAYAMLVPIFMVLGALGLFMGMMLKVIAGSRRREENK